MARNFVKRNDTYRQDFLRNNKGLFGIYFCYYCGMPITKNKMQVDHIMPISKLGGTNMRYNLAPACPKCNRKKSNKVDHRVAIGYSRKLLGFVLSIPLKIIGSLLQLFIRMNWKMKIIVVVAVFIFLKMKDLI